MSKTTKIYDKEGVYDAEISPLVKKIIAICDREGVSFLMSFYLKDSIQGQLYCTSYKQYDCISDLLRSANKIMQRNKSNSFLICTKNIQDEQND